MVLSVAGSVETYVAAGNKLGKDWQAARIILAFFLSRIPCRIVTTSATADHLRVLWGEMGAAISEADLPPAWYWDRRAVSERLEVNHLQLRMIRPDGTRCPISYVVGMVASPDHIAAMQGHHVAQTGDGIPRTLFVSDESSSVPDAYYKMANTWANRLLIFGNTWPCENFFRKGVDGGDKKLSDGSWFRKVIRIRADDSPNVRHGLEHGREASPLKVPGVKTFQEFQQNLETYDEQEKCVKLWAEFYEGKELKLFPPAWLALAEEYNRVALCMRTPAQAIGCDPAEGGDKTSMAAVNRYGVKEVVSRKTPNTDDVPNELVAFGRKHGVPPENWLIDRGGGGKQHADRLRGQGLAVRTVAFGEAPALELKRGLHQLKDRKENQEERYAYTNMRGQLYGELSEAFDPAAECTFALVNPEVRFQLSKFPKRYDEEGRLKLPPKNRTRQDSKEPTLVDLIGHSPDEADSVVLGYHGIIHKARKSFAGGI